MEANSTLFSLGRHPLSLDKILVELCNLITNLALLYHHLGINASTLNLIGPPVSISHSMNNWMFQSPSLGHRDLHFRLPLMSSILSILPTLPLPLPLPLPTLYAYGPHLWKWPCTLSHQCLISPSAPPTWGALKLIDSRPPFHPILDPPLLTPFSKWMELHPGEIVN